PASPSPLTTNGRQAGKSDQRPLASDRRNRRSKHGRRSAAGSHRNPHHGALPPAVITATTQDRLAGAADSATLDSIRRSPIAANRRPPADRSSAIGREKTGMNSGRLRDGVFAVAITLLVLNVHVRGPGHGSLLHQFGDLWPAYAALCVSFFVIGA